MWGGGGGTDTKSRLNSLQILLHILAYWSLKAVLGDRYFIMFILQVKSVLLSMLK